MTSSSPNDTTQLLEAEAESSGKIVTDGSNTPPPPYEMVVGQSSVSNQSVSGQSSIGNYHTPVSQQPPPYSYTLLQPATGQFNLPGGVSALPTGQPVYLIPATALPANSYQPWVISQYGTIQSQSIRTQPTNMRVSRRARELDPYDEWTDCRCFVIFFMTVATILFIMVIVLGFFSQR